MPFHAFGASHIGAVVLMFAGAIALVAASRAANRPGFDKGLRFVLAFFLIADWAAYLLIFYLKGWLALGNVLPLNLCDWATIAVVVTLIRPSQRSYDLCYFWALAGTLLTTITPDLQYDFPDWRFVFFFFYHAIIITAVLYMTFALRMRPVRGSIARAAQWTLGYVAVAGTADWLLGTNYGFLRAKPAAATLFDAMAPWPWYIAESFVIAIAAMLILYAPFWIADRVEGAALAR
ncbi:MAG TPA: TIGR02206 family membrane protein [Rhizomicrobium sp.]|nr:TIGR02206 family membrane protein [Rhizomicrobium sp.]